MYLLTHLPEENTPQVFQIARDKYQMIQHIRVFSFLALSSFISPTEWAEWLQVDFKILVCGLIGFWVIRMLYP